jgi:hypothetical protein
MTKYLLTVGLLDKDSKVQEISTVHATKVVTRMVTAKIGFGTILDANGVYKHADGTLVTEPSIRIEILDTEGTIERDIIIELANELKITLNQESILFEQQVITGAFI